MTLDLMIDAPGPVLTSPPVPFVNLCIPLLLYPIEKMLSFAIAVWAPFDPDLDIRWGPVGALAGVTLPWVTLIPYILPVDQPTEVNLAPHVFEEFRLRVLDGKGVRAYTELVQECDWPGGSDALHSVHMQDPSTDLEARLPGGRFRFAAAAGGPPTSAPPPEGGALDAR